MTPKILRIDGKIHPSRQPGEQANHDAYRDYTWFAGLAAVFGLVLMVCAAPEAASQDHLLREEEAPATLVDLDIAGEEVSLFAAGSWSGTVAGSLGIAWTPSRGILFPTAFPGMPPPFLFEQVPDLTLSLWLLERFFFETSFLEGFELNSFLLGYQGMEGEFLQQVRVGNAEIAMDPYAMVSFPAADTSSPGAAALFESTESRHEVMLRYDPSAREEVLFLGMNELVEERLALAEYDRQAFVLPDAGVEGVTLYLEDAEGGLPGSDGKSYREAQIDEVRIDAGQGFLRVRESAPGRILVFYTKDSAPVGSPGLGSAALCPLADGVPDPTGTGVDFSFDLTGYAGEDMEDRRITVAGRDCLLLSEPGGFSPFVMANRYRISGLLPDEPSRIRAKYVLRGSSAPVPDASPAFRVEDDVLVVQPSPDDPRDFTNQYPFSPRNPELYGPERTTQPSYADAEILLRILRPVSSVAIGSNALAGSVRVLRNGREERNFTFDPASGTLDFPVPVRPDERILVTYRTGVDDTSSGDLLFGIGNRLRLAPWAEVDAALGLRWNALADGFTDRPAERTGAVLAGAGLTVETGTLTADLSAGASYSNPNTTGRFRLLGMDEDVLPVNVAGGRIRPGGVPTDLPVAEPVTRENRGILIYKDYRSGDQFGGGVLQPYTWDGATEYPYASGSLPGPYPAAAPDAGLANAAMVLDYEIGNAQRWVAGELLIAEGDGPRDFSGLTGLTFAWRALQDTGEVRAFVQAGAVTEDIDGDDELDAEVSELSAGFAFDDPANGAVLLVGGLPNGESNGTRETEDVDGDGILDRERPDLVVTEEPALPGETWRRTTLLFTEAQRRKLSQVRALRVVLVRTGGEAASGRVLLGDVAFTGSELYATADAPGTLTVRNVAEAAAIDPPDEPLIAAFPEVERVFHPKDEAQRVLEARWDGLPAGGSWSARTYVAGRPAASYGGLVFYYRLTADTVGDPELSIAVVDAADRGLTVTLPVEATDRWRRVQVDLASGATFVDGERIEATVDTDGDTAGAASVRFTLKGSESGVLYLDELHLADPEGMLGVGARGSARFVRDGALVRAGRFTVLGNLDLRQELSYTGAGFAPGFADPFTTSSVASLSTVATDLLVARIEAEMDLLWSGVTAAIRGGHSVTVPAGGGGLSLSDTYSHGRTATSFSRGNKLSLRLFGVNSVFGTDAVAREEVFRQGWSASVQGTLGEASSASLSASAVHAAEGVPGRPPGYVDAWLQGYRYLTPWNPEEYVERRGSADGRVAVGTRPVGLSLAPRVEYAVADRGRDRVQQDSGSVELTVPVRLQGPAGGVSATPGYRRGFAHRRSAPGVGAFPEDVRLLAEGLQGSRYLYAAVPYAELFDAETPRLFAEYSAERSTARYSPGASLEFGRQVGSRIVDLFTPAALRVGVTRSLQREAGTLRDGLTTDLSLRSTALNLFGAFGAYSLTDAYETEEITHAIQLTVATTEPLQNDGARGAGEPTRRIDAVVQQFLDFSGGNERGLSVDSRMAVRWGDPNEVQGKSMLSYRWGALTVEPPLPRMIERLVDAPPVLSHNEVVRYDGTLWNPDSTVLPAEVLATHESTLRFGTQGSVTALIGLGWARLPVSAGETQEPIHHVGIQGELRGRIVF